MSPTPLGIVVAVCCSVAAGVMLRGSDARPVTAYSPAPVSLEVQASLVPVQAAGRVTLVYELHVADSASRPLRLERVEVPDSDKPNADGASVIVRPATDLVVASPVGAGDWGNYLGLSNTSEHRRAAIRVGDDTVPHLAQRFAVDWVKLDARGVYARDRRGRRNVDWSCYGEPALAVRDARVVGVVDSIPDNTPGQGHVQFRCALPRYSATTSYWTSVLATLGTATRSMRISNREVFE